MGILVQEDSYGTSSQKGIERRLALARKKQNKTKQKQTHKSTSLDELAFLFPSAVTVLPV